MANHETVKYGHKTFTLTQGALELTGTTITEKALPNEDENTFLMRLLAIYGDEDGTIEIVIKQGRPEYAIICVN
jgi:hypothetical protein